MKTCSKCGETKSLDQFKPGRVCFTCANARQRAYRLKTGNSETRMRKNDRSFKDTLFADIARCTAAAKEKVRQKQDI